MNPSSPESSSPSPEPRASAARYGPGRASPVRWVPEFCDLTGWYALAAGLPYAVSAQDTPITSDVTKAKQFPSLAACVAWCEEQGKGLWRAREVEIPEARPL